LRLREGSEDLKPVPAVAAARLAEGIEDERAKLIRLLEERLTGR